MSDTDDTDVLLLIPPDFFLIHTDSEEPHHEKNHVYCDPHCGVVDTLISQVHRLENRLNKIEVSSEQSHFSSMSSCNSTLIPLSEMSEHLFKNNYHDGYLPSSTKSTPQKPRSKFNVASVPSTPSTDKPGSSKYRRPPRFTSRLSTRLLQEPSKQSFTQNQSTDADESVVSSSPEKVNSKKMLGEIDQFLNNVKTIQRVSSNQSVQEPLQPQIELNKPVITLSDLKTNSNEPEKRVSQLNLKDVDRLLHAMESQQKFMDLRDRQIESLYENKNFTKSQQSWQCGDNKGSVPDLGYGIKDLLYSEETLRPSGPSVKTNPGSHDRRESKSDSQSNSEQTLQTVLEKTPTKRHILPIKSSPAIQSNIPDKIKTNTPPQKLCPSVENPETDSSNEIYEIPKDETIEMEVLRTPSKPLPEHLSNMSLLQYSQAQTSTKASSINLFSLADIWNSYGTKDLKISDKEMKKLLPKLEEEKCRRKHCEKLIQELQMKILEMQQRLAVAVQVDSAKDEAILKFHEAWEKVADRWKSLESERNKLSQQILAIEEKSSTELAESAQKVVYYELEMSKALNIAKHSQEKCNALEEEKNEVIKQLSVLKIEIKTSQESLNDVAKEKEQLCDKIQHLEKESVKEKKKILETQNEIAKSKTIFLNCQNELVVLKNDYVRLELNIKDKQSVIFDLESQKNNLQISLESMQKNELILQKQIKHLQEESERAKQDLRNFYQQQVEVLVKDKLKEFQEQLEQAEKSLQEELQLREQTIAKAAAKQLQKLSEKHRLEIQLIEEKHKEEVRLYELQFNQMKQQINMLQTKLDSYQTRRTNIAQELHNVMEQQWLEALKIINNGKSPQANSPHAQSEAQRGSNHSSENHGGSNHPSETQRGSNHPSETHKNSKYPSETHRGANHPSEAFKGEKHSSEAFRGEKHPLEVLRGSSNHLLIQRGSDNPAEGFTLQELRNILSTAENSARKAEDQTSDAQQKLDNEERYNVKYRTKSTVTDLPFLSMPTELYQTPVSSKHKEDSLPFSENELQKYIKLLLDKMPKNTSEKHIREERRSHLSSQESSTSDFVDVSSSWSQVPSQRGNDRSNFLIKEQRSGKPPWK